MDPKQIRDLIELISRSNFATFELEEQGFKLRLVKGPEPSAPAGPAALEPPRPPAVAEAPRAPTPSPAPAPAAAPAPVAVETENGVFEMHSPIVGTFYRAPTPDAPPFVEIGQKVQKGQVVCIVEAMKLMNEIESEIDGEVLEAPVANGQPVEYGEVLFRLRPSG